MFGSIAVQVSCSNLRADAQRDGKPVRPGGAGAAKEARGAARLRKATVGVAHEPAEQARAASDDGSSCTTRPRI